MPNQSFAINLRLVCDQHRSVAHVCRSLQMNRQQFNKYLSGKIYPSKHNLLRICHFFRLSEEQFNLEPGAFKQVVAESSLQQAETASSEIEKVIGTLPSSGDALSRYEGYYHSHFHGLGFPGRLIRSLVHIYRHQDAYYTRNVEHLWNKEKHGAQRNRFKYEGMAFYLGDRIFITEVETHMPSATRVEFHFLGKQVDLRQALRDCGIFDLDSDRIDSDIRDRINNQITENEFLLTARDF